MLKKLVAMLVASAFAFSAFAQAPKSDTAPKAQAGTEAKKDTKVDKKKARAERKASKNKSKGKAKSDQATK
jgi:Ni/Co efflux regulator RcnB